MFSRVSLLSFFLVILGVFRLPVAAQIVVGSLVRTTESGVAVRSIATSVGNLLGTQSAGIRGMTTNTSTFDGVDYWRVDFETGSDGWVLASKLELAPPNPITVTSVSPSTLQAGLGSVSVTLTGTGFRADDVVYLRFPGGFRDTFLPGVVVNSAQSITVPITPGLYPGLGYLYVARGFEDGESAPFGLAIEAPVPVITTATPTEILTGTSPEIQVTGQGFMLTSSIFFNGGQLTSTPVYTGPNITGLKATLDPFYTADAGVFPLTVYTGADGTGSGGYSSELSVMVLDAPDGVNPVLAITLPAEAAALDTTEALLTGTASDDRGQVEVMVRSNGGDWQSTPVELPGTAWRAYAPLVTGSNFLEIQARDSSGNLSPIVSRTVTTTSQFRDGQPIAYSMVDGAFSFTFRSFPGALYDIEKCTGDLENDWGVREPGRPSSGTSTTFTEETALEQAPRAFYRARRL